MFALVFISGCTLWEPSSNNIEPLTISLESDLTDVKSDDTTYLYLVLDNLDKNEEYDIETNIMSPGMFDVTEGPSDTELSGLQKETLEWKLSAPSVDKEISSTVSVETSISREFEFYVPIKFGEPDYLRKREQGGNPIPKDPKTYPFSDNLVSINVELNKNPPFEVPSFEEGAAYANMEVNSKVGGILNLTSVSLNLNNEILNNKCEIDTSDTISCEFPSGHVNKIEEKRFKITLNYDVKIIKSKSFMILPK